LCTDPADRPAAEAAIRDLYELAGQDGPQFLWCQSPAAIRLIIRMLDPDYGHRRALKVGEIPGYLEYPRPGLLARSTGELNRWLGDSLTSAPIGHELRRELGLLLGGAPQTRSQLIAASRAEVLSRPLPELLGEPLGEAAEKSLRSIRWPVPTRSHWGNESSSYLGNGWTRGGGQFDSYIAKYAVPRRLSLVTYQDEDSKWLDVFCVLNRSCGWWEPYERICFITERPAVIRAEAAGASGWSRPHCPDGPAITYRDGWSFYAWHGTRVPATLIQDGWDAGAIMAERNAEVRRCAIEKLGWNAFEQHLISVASAPDPGNPGQVLTLCELPAEIRDTYPWPVRLLLCSNGTPEPDGTRRRFALQVPPRHTDPVAAAAELYGWTRDEYAALARRA
jgi:hypothetical protein